MEDMSKDGKKSLMYSVEKFETTATLMDELFYLSETMINKFNRTEIYPKGEGMISKQEPKLKTPDIIDLLDGSNYKINTLRDKIKTNIDRIIMMIE